MLFGIWILWKHDRYVGESLNNLHIIRRLICTYLDYCGAGCQTAFGTCTGTTVQPSENTFTCGASNGGLSCTGGLCCSTSGYCGNTTDYCDVGCQSKFGACTTAAAEPATGGTCGPNFGGATCGGNQCCSGE